MAVAPYIKVWDRNDNMFLIDANEEPRIDAAVSSYIDSGRLRDSILDLTDIAGAQVKILASEIVSWVMFNAQTRLAYFVWEQELEEENKDLQHQAGIWEDGD